MANLLRKASALLLVFSLACAGPLEEAGVFRTADGPEIAGTGAVVTYRPAARDEPLGVSNHDAAHTIRMFGPQLVRVAMEPDLARRRMLELKPPPAVESLLLDGTMDGHIVLASADLTLAQQKALTDQYLRHCQETHHNRGDCLNAMNGEPYLGREARYRLACHFALASVWDGMTRELGDMLNLDRIESAIIFGFVTWAVLAVLPEPFSKFLAVAMTVAMTAWLGVDALTNVIGGWVEMAAAADRATTLAELMMAGDAYGKRMGEQTVRLVVMLVASLIGERGVANLPKLPKFGLATQRLAAAGGPGLEAVSAAEQASVSGGRVTVVYAKAAKGTAAGVVAAAGLSGEGRLLQCKEEVHHIGTVENEKARWNGGPWTPRFEDLFERVGLSMESKYNKVKVFGHVGPHPREYHQIVYERLSRVFATCDGVAACRAAFIAMLEKLANEIGTPGSDLNDLVTRGCGKAR